MNWAQSAVSGRRGADRIAAQRIGQRPHPHDAPISAPRSSLRGLQPPGNRASVALCKLARLLAAALEMLGVALGIHRCSPFPRRRTSTVLINGAILMATTAGVRATASAPQTDNPRIVALFSTALQDISENNLRVPSSITAQTRRGARFPPKSTRHSAALRRRRRPGTIRPERRATNRPATGRPQRREATRNAQASPVSFDADLLAALPVPHQERWRALQRRFAAAASGN